jgi:hypothetical protein
MKKIFKLIAAALLGGVVAVACQPGGTTTDEEFDPALLIGEWSFNRDIGGSPHLIHHKFNSDGTGWEQDITDDAPQMAFKWTLNGDELALYHWSEMEQQYGIPETGTVTTLTATRLVYRTQTGRTITCTKQ